MLTRIKETIQKRHIFFVTMFVFLIGFIAASIAVSADSFYTVRINYLFRDGTPAHDAYIASYRSGDNVDITVTNPSIAGFTPMTAVEEGDSAFTTELKYNNLSENKTVNVYYIAGLTHYRAIYYKQNIYDDLYTRDNTLSSSLTDRYGYTGSNPTDLEDIQFQGFTNLFHEPDAIAADGSTVFRVYYDRNYYTVNFDLGSGGYGVDTVYAKYESVYHIGEPKREGYTFEGWVRTNKDGTKFYDENDNEIQESEIATKKFDLHDGVIRSENTYYRAVWTPKTTSYSVVYWIEKPNSKGVTADYIEDNSNSKEEAQAIIAEHYAVVAAKDVTDVTSGYHVTLDEKIYNEAHDNTKVAIKDFFKFNLNEQGKNSNGTPRVDSNGHPLDSKGKKLDFPTMSAAQRSELTGDKKFYYEFNESLSNLQFNGKYEGDHHTNSIEVKGDGTTRINIYLDRKDFKLQFFFAKTLHDSNDNITKLKLTGGTGGFSRSSEKTLAVRLSKATWNDATGTTLPEFSDIRYDALHDKVGSIETTENNIKVKYWYYELESRYNAEMSDVWFNDAFKLHGTGNPPTRFTSWASEKGTKYNADHPDNLTVKGYYERFSEDLMFKSITSTGTDRPLTELHFLASWTQKINKDQIYNFTYKNYVQILPFEEFLAENNGYDFLINGGDYEAGEHQEGYDDEGNPKIYYYEAGHYDGRYTDIIINNGIKYGLLPQNNVETYDWGTRYSSALSTNGGTLPAAIKLNQTPVALKGFALVADNAVNSTYTHTYVNQSGTAVTENVTTDCGNLNPQSTWYAANSFDAKHHADVMFFYSRNSYKLKYRNDNKLEGGHIYDAAYNSPLNLRRFQYTPEYPYPDRADYYNFEGWFYDPYHLDEVDFTSDRMRDDDVTLYAKWTPKKINVSFYNTYNDYYVTNHSSSGRVQNLRIKCIKNENYDPENPGDTEKWVDGDIITEYGDYIRLGNIPVNTTDTTVDRPALAPPAEGAQFAGWYYLRDNVPVRFEPENIPVTALNEEAANDGKLQLFAEWVTKDVAKYRVKYVENDNPDVEVADSTEGRAFEHKTKTFNAKCGEELNASHAWVEDGINWWPTINSHSIVIQANEQGNSYAPNEFSFQYIRRSSVHYRIQYLDATTRMPLKEEKIESSNKASIAVDAPFISGYVVTEGTKTMVLAASTKDEGSPEARAEELETNVLTFYYNKNDTDYLYEVEYYTQNTNNDNYSLYQQENITVPIVIGGDTTVSVAALYDRPIPEVLKNNGFERKAGAVEVVEVSDSTENPPYSVADNGFVTISPGQRSTIRIYYDRKTYTYAYDYIDHSAEKAYNDALANGEDVTGMWNGVIQSFTNKGPERVDKEVTIDVETDITYNGTPYTRMSNNDIKFTIAPAIESNPDINYVKIYYKKYTERELEFKLSCKNEDSPDSDVDYDINTGEPLYGGISLPLQTIDSVNDIQSVTFYNFNDARVTGSGGVESYKHLHKYTFLGWYDNPEGEGTPLTTNETITKDDLGITGHLPSRDKVYYAVVEQELVKANFEFRTVEEDLPSDNNEAAAIVAAAPTDAYGDKTGGYFNFSSPTNYQNDTYIPWHRTGSFSMSIEPKDNRVYKYEFAEWWEEDLTNGGNSYIRHYDWNTTTLHNKVTQNSDKHIIAVYKKRAVTSLPYEVKYKFKSRTGDIKDYVVKGTLTGDQLNEGDDDCCINSAGDFQLTDNFIMSKAPFESNYGETLTWTDRDDRIVKTSEKGETASEDKIITTVTAEQVSKKVHVHYRLDDSDVYTTIETTLGFNREDDMVNVEKEPSKKHIKDIDLREAENFSYWAIRKSENGEIIAKCTDPFFNYCIMDNYWISPVFNETVDTTPDIKLSHIDYSRNRWTDDDGNDNPNGSTDLLYSDFEIAFSDGNNIIYGDTSEYQVGVVFELCATMPDGVDFVEGKDYKAVTDYDALETAVKNNSESYYYKPNKQRSIQVKSIPTENLTNMNRVEYGASYVNNYTEDNEGTRTYTNANYLLKATAYLIDSEGNLTFSNSIYVCLKDVSKKDLASGEMKVITTND